ncbi:MAG TPA: hypothetical protein VGG85_16145 [Terracidiphilus sp.]|jgi:hypothetical protein
MPIPAKACEGRFSEEVQEILTKNIDRAQWANHTCQVCGLSVGAKQDRGQWVPEQHWPSVKYHARGTAQKKQHDVRAEDSTAEEVVSDDIADLAGSASH